MSSPTWSSADRFSTDRSGTEQPSGRHQVNIAHLVMGLAFLGIVGVWALVQSDTVTGDDIRWLLPIPWVVAGAVGLVVTAFTGQRRYAVRQTGWVGADPGVTPARPAPEPVPDLEADPESDTERPETPETPEPESEEPADVTETVDPAETAPIASGLPKYPRTTQPPEEQP